MDIEIISFWKLSLTYLMNFDYPWNVISSPQSLRHKYVHRDQENYTLLSAQGAQSGKNFVHNEVENRIFLKWGNFLNYFKCENFGLTYYR